jgi:hypothetical protein
MIETVVYSWGMTIVCGLAIWFCVNKFIVEKNNPYAFSSFFDRSLVKIKMFEVVPASYSDQVTKPMIRFRGMGVYGPDGLYFKGLYPVNKDYFIWTGEGNYQFYYKSGGQKSIIPLLMTMFYSDSVKPEHLDVQEIEGVPVEDRQQPTSIVTENHEALNADALRNRDDIRNGVPLEHSTLAFLVPSVDQLETMTDNFIENFMTRQQAIMAQVMGQFDILSKVIVPIGLFLIITLALLATAMTFSSQIIESSVKAIPSLCTAYATSQAGGQQLSNFHAGNDTTASTQTTQQTQNTQTAPQTIFGGILPIPK